MPTLIFCLELLAHALRLHLEKYVIAFGHIKPFKDIQACAAKVSALPFETNYPWLMINLIETLNDLHSNPNHLNRARYLMNDLLRADVLFSDWVKDFLRVSLPIRGKQIGLRLDQIDNKIRDLQLERALIEQPVAYDIESEKLSKPLDT